VTDEGAPREAWVALGRVVGIYGVRGWLRVESWTDPRVGILDYRRWWLGANARRSEHALSEGRLHGRGVVARLEGIGDRDAARSLLGTEIAVPRDALPPSEEFYWADLIGLAVENRNGVALGKIRAYLETGGHDVMVISDGARERLIPWAPGVYVDKVSLAQGRVIVDWNPRD
jgi:16S rRNA processing protein RimM